MRAQAFEQVRAYRIETLEMSADGLAIHLDQPTAAIAIGEWEERLQPRRTGLALEDVIQQPARLDQADVVKQRTNAVQRGIGTPVQHLRSDPVELANRIAAGVLQGRQPATHLGIIGDRFQDESLPLGCRHAPPSAVGLEGAWTARPWLVIAYRIAIPR